MKKRFIVALNSATKTQDEQFIEFIDENNLGWWHWLATTWLIDDKKGKFTAPELRSALRKIYPDTRMMVFELSEEGDSWAGFGPTNDKKDMFGWIERNWKN